MSIAHVVILAAGEGNRSQISGKQFFEMGGKPLFEHALGKFMKHKQVEKIIIVVRQKDHEKMKQWLNEKRFQNVSIAIGGTTRQESARAGFERLKDSAQVLSSDDVILFHNAANPFVTASEITEVIRGAKKHGAAFVAHPASDTLKVVEEGRAIRTLDRDTIWQAQTPQGVKVEHYEHALKKGGEGTDEMILVEGLGLKPWVALASKNNFKITTKRDLEFAHFLVEGSNMRTGFGMDSHRFERTHRGLTLGGLYIPEAPKMIANSDGDVMIHSLCNALLQAMGEGSLGTIADEMFEQGGVTDSANYLEKILGKMSKQNLAIHHVGFQLEGAQPRIDPIVEKLKSSLILLLNITEEQLGITATSGEDLTPFGLGEGLQCFATVTLKIL